MTTRHWALNLVLALGLSLALGVPAARAADPPALKVDATLEEAELLPTMNYGDLVKVRVRDDQEVPVAGAEVTVSVSFGTAKVFSDPTEPPAVAVQVKTNDLGVATVSLSTPEVDASKAPAVFVLLVIAKKGPSAGQAQVGGTVGSGFPKTFFSDRVASELFLGASFARKFDADGKSEGFNETTPLGRLSIDTLWKYESEKRGHGRLHTGLEVIFSAFPTAAEANDATGMTTKADDNTPEKFVDFADSFSGRLILTWQPDAWASHSRTGSLSQLPYDALRWGLFAKVGAISRDTLTENQDSLIRTAQLGFSLTHHQTVDATARQDRQNVVPARFIEISYAYFEEFGKRKDTGMVVVDAGFRLARTGGTDFYAGIHLAGGKGEDDVRVFAGFLFHLDKIPTLF